MWRWCERASFSPLMDGVKGAEISADSFIQALVDRDTGNTVFSYCDCVNDAGDNFASLFSVLGLKGAPSFSITYISLLLSITEM